MRKLVLVLLVLFPSAALGVSVIGAGASVTVGTEATALDDPSIDDARYHRRLLVCVPEDAAAPIYVGPASVTVASGMPVPQDACFSIALAAKTKLYAIAEVPVAVRVQEYY